MEKGNVIILTLGVANNAEGQQQHAKDPHCVEKISFHHHHHLLKQKQKRELL
jgi:hypothetical protein